MNKVWKWILGIVVVLVVIAALGGLVYVWLTHPAVMTFNPRNAPFGPRGMLFGPQGPHMFQGGRGPMMYGRHFFPFFGAFMLIGGLIKLAFFGALLYFAYWLGRRNARIALDPKPAAPSSKSDSTPKPARKVAKS